MYPRLSTHTDAALSFNKKDCSKDKECQRDHWPNHKSFCDNCDDELQRGRKVAKGEEPLEIMMTHAGPVVNMGEFGDGPVLPPGVPSGLPLIRKALYEMMSHRNANIQYGEKAYMNMYNDLVQNEEDWLEVRFIFELRDMLCVFSPFDINPSDIDISFV